MKLFRLKYKSIILQFGYLIIIATILLNACSPVKNVSDNEYLLDRYRIKVKGGNIKKEELKSYVRQKPNKRVLGIRFHLWLYNMSNQDKDKGLSNWFRTIGEEPVIYDSYVSRKSKELLKSHLNNKGYYNSIVKDTVQLKRKRARVLYKVEVNDPYIIRNINYSCSDTNLIPDVLPDTVNSVISEGDKFDLDILEEERQRVEVNLKDKGYYNFNKEFIFFSADSSVKDLNVDLRMNIQRFQVKGPNNEIINTNHKRYLINKVFVFTNFDQKEALAQKNNYYKDIDTTYVAGIYFISKGEDKLSKRVVLQSNFMQEGELYSLNNANKTYKHLNSLRLFKTISINFNEIDSLQDDSLGIGFLNCNIQLTKFFKQSYTAEFEVTNSNSNIGFGGNLLYRNRSLFGGAEITDFRINGSIETIDTLIELKEIED